METEALLRALMAQMSDVDLVAERDMMLIVAVDSECPNLKLCLAECEKRGL